ncbi:MAG: nucleotide exchange factor GrpE [Selenomonas sp.]|uniref:nucleotide exchange factor GrpE n=1 Tax=Selenomonas sp. TaxID=2053611 RepID=UPI0025F21383|nr:nucleotide exchange factor GrpE [Selenomonas sp.]MCR5757830.1 nucleotide exchange factor GrpE [Selenomonas sp.]
MKDELKKKDEQKLEEMQQEINAADADESDEAEEAASESAEDEKEAEQPQDEHAAQIEKLTADLKEKEDRALRLQADFENFRRRTSKEKEELSAVVTQGMLKDMLPLLDNFERAMAAEAKDSEAFQKGVEMIFTQFTEILKKNGLEHIEVEGQKFDPNFHQAVMRVQNADLEDDDIAQELQKGYMVKGRVIRPAMVQVVAN